MHRPGYTQHTIFRNLSIELKQPIKLARPSNINQKKVKNEKVHFRNSHCINEYICICTS